MILGFRDCGFLGLKGHLSLSNECCLGVVTGFSGQGLMVFRGCEGSVMGVVYRWCSLRE